MKNIVGTILRTGYSKTQKYCVADLPYFLRPIVEDCEWGIRANGNPFWNKDNNEKRMALLYDMRRYRENWCNGSKFSIVNRYENGDAYGIDKEFAKIQDVGALIVEAGGRQGSGRELGLQADMDK